MPNVIAVIVVYSGFVVTALAIVALIRPLKVLRLAPRRRAAILLMSGLALILTGMLLPAGETRVARPVTRLDEFMPNYEFSEIHTLLVAAPPESVYKAIHQVTAGEIRFFRLLTTVRRLGRPGPESILNAPEHMPILQVATRTTFVTLADDPNREVVVGTVVLAPPGFQRAQMTADDLKALSGPGFALAAMNFRLTPNDSGSTRVTTETRVHGTDRATQRRFARYWRVIYPGSALIRRSWLKAIRRRAESKGLGVRG